MDNRDYDSFKKYVTNDEITNVTRYMYLKALEIIDMYHRQNDKSIKIDHLTEITKWEYFNTCSLRLKNTLISIMQGIKYYSELEYKEFFIENIDTKKMRTIRGVGISTINEFIKLRGY